MKKRITILFLIIFCLFNALNVTNVNAFQSINIFRVYNEEADPDEILTNPDFDLNSVDEGVLSKWYSGEINVPDEALKKALQNASKTDVLTVEAMFSLPTSLNLSGLNIKDLTGLEYAINVTDLDISDNAIESLDPLSDLYNLKTLNYSHNNVIEIPGWLFESESLISVDGSYNASTEISEFDVENSSLRIVYLENNKLTQLPEMKGLENLETLSLANNDFTVYPAYIGQLPKLKVLSLSGNKLTTVEQISGNTALTTLYLNNNELSSLPTGIETLPVLSELSVSNNNIELIDESIAGLQTLERFDISFNKLNDIPESISEMPALKVFDINFNFIKTNGDNADKLKKIDENTDNFYYTLQLPEFEVCLYEDFNSDSGRLEWNSVESISSSEGSYNVVKYVVERKEIVNDISDEANNNVTSDIDSTTVVNSDEDLNLGNGTDENADNPQDSADPEVKENVFTVIGEVEPAYHEFVDETAEKNKEYEYKITAYIEGEYKSHGKVSFTLEDTVTSSDIISVIADHQIWIYLAIGVTVILVCLLIYKLIKRTKDDSASLSVSSGKDNDINEEASKKIISTQHIKSTSKADLEDELDRILFSAKEEAEKIFPEEKKNPISDKKSEIENIFDEVKKDKRNKK